MNRSKLESFISKYNLAGACESVTCVCSNDAVSVRSISSDKNVLGEVTMELPFLPFGRYSIYETSKFRSMISILNDNFTTTPMLNGGVPYAIKFVDDSKTEVTFVLSDDTIIPDVPDLKKLPEFALRIDLNETFTSTFIKAKAALTETETFTVSSEDGDSEVVLGYNTINTNRIKINVKSNDVGTFKPVSFSADYLRNILSVNKEVTNGVMEISESGLARLTFDTDDIHSVYYLVQIMVTT